MIDNSKSALAIVTGKEGLAAGLAHRHIISASNWVSSLELNDKDGKSTSAISTLQSGTAKISIPVMDLAVDSPEASAVIMASLIDGKHWSAEKDKLEPGNAAKVRENMLAESQLDAAKFPQIEGSGKFSGCQTLTPSSMRCSLELRVTVRGRSVIKTIPVEIKQEANVLSAEFLADYRFTEFGIKPYTALFGAIAVSDEFVLAGRLVTKAM